MNFVHQVLPLRGALMPNFNPEALKTGLKEDSTTADVGVVGKAVASPYWWSYALVVQTAGA
eukprot:521666-Heterocapsa_arctica.AAC.1